MTRQIFPMVIQRAKYLEHCPDAAGARCGVDMADRVERERLFSIEIFLVCLGETRPT